MKSTGEKINELFLDRTLRVEDSSVAKSDDGEVVDFIFARDASVEKYNELLVSDESKHIPDSIRHLIDEKLYR